MRTIIIATIALSLCACGTPDDEQHSNGTTPPSDAASDLDESSDGGTTPNSMMSGDMMSTPDDMGTSTPDASTLPTECVNDCLCESSCSHRCNIQCKTECASGTCDFEFNAGAEVTCRAGSTCTISCESGACEVTCEEGASCELTCGPQTVFCDFVECGGQQDSCNGRRKTCGTSC